MAYERIVYGLQNGAFNYSEFVCDTEEDISKLPTSTKKGILNNKTFEVCSIGSTADVVESGKVYILSNENEWVFFKTRNPDGSKSINIIQLSSLPDNTTDGSNISNGQIVQYTGNTTEEPYYASGYFYKASINEDSIVWENIGAIPAIILTQEEYDVLSEQKKNNGCFYYIVEE